MRIALGFLIALLITSPAFAVNNANEIGANKNIDAAVALADISSGYTAEVRADGSVATNTKKAFASSTITNATSAVNTTIVNATTAYTKAILIDANATTFAIGGRVYSSDTLNVTIQQEFGVAAPAVEGAASTAWAIPDGYTDIKTSYAGNNTSFFVTVTPAALPYTRLKITNNGAANATFVGTWNTKNAN